MLFLSFASGLEKELTKNTVKETKERGKQNRFLGDPSRWMSIIMAWKMCAWPHIKIIYTGHNIVSYKLTETGET